MLLFMHSDEEIMSEIRCVEENVFRRCKLKNSQLVYSGCAFEWSDTSFENCYWSFRGPAEMNCSIPNVFGIVETGQNLTSSVSRSTIYTHFPKRQANRQ